jgi:hypothetical protein
MDSLEAKLKSFLVCIALLEIVSLGIILINLSLLILVFTRQGHLDLKFLRNSSVDCPLLKNLSTEERSDKKNTLANILEISSPVRMLFIRSSGIPFAKGFGSWSFGADQCASSEGFLVTFTPRVLRSQVFDFYFLSEYFAEVHRFCGIIAFPVPLGRSVETRETPSSSHSTHCEHWVGTNPSVLRTSLKFWKPKFLETIETSAFYLGEVVIINLMTPNPGILVAENPTDEGRIGTGRNPYESNLEANG